MDRNLEGKDGVAFNGRRRDTVLFLSSCPVYRFTSDAKKKVKMLDSSSL